MQPVSRQPLWMVWNAQVFVRQVPRLLYSRRAPMLHRVARHRMVSTARAKGGAVRHNKEADGDAEEQRGAGDAAVRTLNAELGPEASQSIPAVVTVRVGGEVRAATTHEVGLAKPPRQKDTGEEDEAVPEFAGFRRRALASLIDASLCTLCGVGASCSRHTSSDVAA